MKKTKSFGEKPYNRCLSCHHRQARCDGPRTSAMPLLRWCEFMRDMKELNGLTNADIAEKAEISVKTVERLMALNDEKDILRDTARRIEDAIIGSSNQYPCYLAFEEEHPDSEMRLNEALRELERALADNKDYRDALENIHTSYNAEMQAIRDEAQKKADYLLSELNRARQNNERLCREIDYLWEENQRKSVIIDMFMKNQNTKE